MKKIIPLLLLLCSLGSFAQTSQKQEDNTIYSLAGLQVKPEFPGGVDKLKSLVNESYLKSGFAYEKKGKVYALFVIEKDGSLSDIKILRGLDKDKAAALIEILKNQSKWTPGKQNSQTVRVLYALTLVIGS